MICEEQCNTKFIRRSKVYSKNKCKSWSLGSNLLCQIKLESNITPQVTEWISSISYWMNELLQLLSTPQVTEWINPASYRMNLLRKLLNESTPQVIEQINSGQWIPERQMWKQCTLTPYIKKYYEKDLRLLKVTIRDLFCTALVQTIGRECSILSTRHAATTTCQ